MRIRAVLLATVAAVLFPVQAEAAGQPESAPAAQPADKDIVVTAARRADTARKEEQAALNIVDIQSAETIAKYPDVNAAEALGRIPGVALSVDTSEGRFVNIRGLDGNLNGATFGGVVLLNTQPGGTYFNAAGRAVEFDTVPIGAVDRIVVTKTGTPDRDAEGLGGTVELTPRTAMGIEHPFADITLGGGLETFRNTGLYRDEVVIGAPFGGTNADGKAPFSFVATQFLYNDQRNFDDIEEAYVDAAGTPNKAYDSLELRRYNYNRKRFGYSGELDFTLNDDHRIYARISIAGYNEQGTRQGIVLSNLGNNIVTDPSNPNGFIASPSIDPATGEPVGPQADKTLRNYDETHRNTVYQLGGVHHLGEVTVDWFGAYSRATYDKHYDYNATFNDPNLLTVPYDNTTDPNHPAFSVTNGGSITNSSNYNLASINNATEYDVDREYSFAGNISVPVHLADDDSIKAGFKLRYRDKIATPLSYIYSYTGPAASAANFTNGVTDTNFYGQYNIGDNLAPSKVVGFLNSQGSLFTENTAAELSRNAGGYFDDTENVSAGYVQYQGNFGALGVLAGARVEHTDAVYRGISETTDGSTVTYAPTSQSHSYTNFFPTLQFRYQVAPSIIARATYSTGIARPGFYQTIQSSSVDVGAGTVSTGNPNLKPIYGNNFDLALEYSPSTSSFISVGLFDKEFQNYIVTYTTEATYPGITGLASINTYSNVSGAYARGIEVAGSVKFASLPGFLGGFGVEANGTHVNSGAQIRPGETIALPGTFKNSANAALFYELKQIKLRLAGEYESSALFGVGGSVQTDIYEDQRLTLDFNGSYDITRNISVYFNAKNLTNAPLRFYEGSPNRPIQREYYDVTLEGGVKIRL